MPDAVAGETTVTRHEAILVQLAGRNGKNLCTHDWEEVKGGNEQRAGCSIKKWQPYGNAKSRNDSGGNMRVQPSSAHAFLSFSMRSRSQSGSFWISPRSRRPHCTCSSSKIASSSAEIGGCSLSSGKSLGRVSMVVLMETKLFTRCANVKICAVIALSHLNNGPRCFCGVV